MSTAILLIFIICAPTVLTQDPRSSPEHYCFLESPIDSTFFNLTTIQHDHNDSIVRIDENEYLRVHFCRALKDPCNGRQYYAVCLHANGSKEIGVGEEPPQVGIEYGKIIFRYTGDKCNESHYYTVDIEMKCNHSMTEKIPVDLDITYSRDQCSFQMSVETSAACAERKQTPCEFKDESGYYNLSPLMNIANNYEIKINSSLSVILNVCHSLIYGEHYQQCNHNTMVCLIDTKNTTNPVVKSYKRLGNINDDTRIGQVRGTLILYLTSDTPCYERDGVTLKNVTTIIQFVCDLFSFNDLPKYRIGYGTCNYKFKWHTRAACKEASLIDYSKLNHKPCKVTDPLHNRLYDLSMLMGKVIKGKSADTNAEYEFSICGPLQNSNCTKPGTGICKYIKDKKMSVSEGLANTNLIWSRGRVYLNYTNGAACGNNRRRYTTISFYCGENDTVTIEDQDPCATIITWQSLMVCNLKCATPDYQINLDQLSRYSNNYVVRGETKLTRYHLNVCKPLVDEDYTNCTGDTGICKVIDDEEGDRISELNLGYAEFGLRRAKDGRLYLSYINGSVCEEDSSKRISTDITFICDVEVNMFGHMFGALGHFMVNKPVIKLLQIFQGTPIFKRYNNCKYDFEWRTGYSCGKTDTGPIEECTFTNTVEVFDFSEMIKNSTFKVNKNESIGYYNVSMCGTTKMCNGTFVCDEIRYRKYVKLTSDFATQNLVVFKLQNATKCRNNVVYNSVIKVWCNIWDGLAEPFLLNDEECSTDFKGIREDVCELEEKDSAKKPPPPSSVAQMILAILSSAFLVVTCFYFRHSHRRTRCMVVMRYYINKCIVCRREPVPVDEFAL